MLLCGPLLPGQPMAGQGGARCLSGSHFLRFYCLSVCTELKKVATPLTTSAVANFFGIPDHFALELSQICCILFFVLFHALSPQTIQSEGLEQLVF